MEKYKFNEKLEKQSEEFAKNHDMLIEALDGQVYLKETMHKIDTSQVTGMALKKVSVGGKGGFGSQGDARDQEKQVEVTSRVMVLCDPSQEAFDHNKSLDKILVAFDENGKPIYINQGERYESEMFVPSHLFGDREIKGLTKFSKYHGRDYDEFTHSNQLDASDRMKAMEVLYAEWDTNVEFAKQLGLEPGRECPITLEVLEEARLRYDELCGYRGAWKYVGVKGAEHRRYTFTVGNLLNQAKYREKKKAHQGKESFMGWEASSYNHNTTAYQIYTDYYNGTKSKEWLDEQMRNLKRKDCVQYMLWQLGENNPWDWKKERVYDNTIVTEPSEDFLEEKAIAEEIERKRRLEAFKKAPDLRDWKKVYNWELTKQGKVLFANEKI